MKKKTKIKKRMKPATKSSKKPKLNTKSLTQSSTLKSVAKSTAKKTGKTGADRRLYARISTPGLTITERNGDFEFVSKAENLSEGGIFLLGRVKDGVNLKSELMIPTGKGGRLRIEAEMVHDRQTQQGYGTGYRFLSLSALQLKSIRIILRKFQEHASS